LLAKDLVLEGPDDIPHTFLIRSILVPTGHELEAIEKTRDDGPGYRFAVLGDFDADPWELFQRFFATMRDAVSTRVVIDGKTFSWEEMGHMLMTGDVALARASHLRSRRFASRDAFPGGASQQRSRTRRVPVRSNRSVLRLDGCSSFKACPV
jgi:hypothetical protein